jgi:hypothetical protein
VKLTREIDLLSATNRELRGLPANPAEVSTSEIADDDKLARIGILLAEIEAAESLRQELLRGDAASSSTSSAGASVPAPAAQEETKYNAIERRMRELEQLEAENIRLKTIAGIPTAAEADDSEGAELDEQTQLDLKRIEALMVELKVEEDEQARLQNLKLQRAREKQQPQSQGSDVSRSSAAQNTSRFSQVSLKAINNLEVYETKMDEMETELQDIESEVAQAKAQSDLPGVKNRLAQLNGHLDKLQATKIDSIITAELKSGNAPAKTKRKALTRRCEELQKRVVATVKKVELLPQESAEKKAQQLKQENEKRRKELETFKQTLQAGIIVKKHGRRGVPHKRTIFITNGKTIYWQKPSTKLNPSDQHCIQWTKVKQVVQGIHTDVLKRTAKSDKDSLCFSLLTDDRSLDIEAPDAKTFETLYNGFRLWHEIGTGKNTPSKRFSLTY